MFITKEPIQSSAIADLQYHRWTKALDVQFSSGATYRYVDVKPSLYRDFRRADSPGRFFSTNVKPYYTCYRLVHQAA